MSEAEKLPEEVSTALVELEAHYENFEPVERGANGFLYFAKNKVSHMDVAVKFYSGEPGDNQHNEPRQLSAIDSQNVLSILDAKSVSDDWGFFITPRCFEGDLDDLIESMPSAHMAIDVALGVCAGVSAIHAMGMLHRDIKPGNIVISDGSPQIADFGSVRVLAENEQDVAASRHSILYRPPESFDSDRYTLQGDIYQIGVVTYQLLGGVLPYDGMHYLNAREIKRHEQITDEVDRSLFIDEVIRHRAQSGRLLDFESLPPWIDGRCKRALRQMVNPSVKSRMTSVADVAAALTQMRTSVANWYWDNDTARLESEERIIELRLIDDVRELYEAYQSIGGNFRRIPKLGIDVISNLIDQI